MNSNGLRSIVDVDRLHKCDGFEELDHDQIGTTCENKMDQKHSIVKLQACMHDQARMLGGGGS